MRGGVGADGRRDVAAAQKARDVDVAAEELVLHEQRLQHVGGGALRKQRAEEVLRGETGDVAHAHAGRAQRLGHFDVLARLGRSLPVVHKRADDAHAVLEHAEVAVVLARRQVRQQLVAVGV